MSYINTLTSLPFTFVVGAGEGEPARRDQKSEVVDGHKDEGGQGVSGARRRQPDPVAVCTPRGDVPETVDTLTAFDSNLITR